MAGQRKIYRVDIDIYIYIKETGEGIEREISI